MLILRVPIIDIFKQYLGSKRKLISKYFKRIIINNFKKKSFESSKSLNYPYILKRYIFIFIYNINTKHDKLEHLYMYMYEPSSPLSNCPVKVASSQSGTTQVLGTCNLHRFNRKYPLSQKSGRVVRYVRTKLSTGRVVHRPNCYSATGKIDTAIFSVGL